MDSARLDARRRPASDAWTTRPRRYTRVVVETCVDTCACPPRLASRLVSSRPHASNVRRVLVDASAIAFDALEDIGESSPADIPATKGTKARPRATHPQEDAVAERTREARAWRDETGANEGARETRERTR